MAQQSEPTLLSLLSNTIILLHVSPYLPISSLLGLARTSKSFNTLIFSTTASVFRHLDLSTAKGASVQPDLLPMDRGGESWRAERMDEALTEEEFYGGPLRGILSSLRRRGVLQGIQTLILDEVSAPADVLHEIICDDQYRVKILSLIGSRNLNEGKLIGSLKYAIRPTRPSNTPSLKGLYIFGMGVLATREIGKSLSSTTIALTMRRVSKLESWDHSISRRTIRSIT